MKASIDAFLQKKGILPHLTFEDCKRCKGIGKKGKEIYCEPCGGSGLVEVLQ